MPEWTSYHCVRFAIVKLNVHFEHAHSRLRISNSVFLEYLPHLALAECLCTHINANKLLDRLSKRNENKTTRARASGAIFLYRLIPTISSLSQEILSRLSANGEENVVPQRKKDFENFKLPETPNFESSFFPRYVYIFLSNYDIDPLVQFSDHDTYSELHK